ncbi:MAG TPA: VCBS repeat-containing protein, partial [Solirubrobacterales bacterium]|nr:VCBS repeat-containing protein [Solirubrobacterales bacterium]
LDSALHDNAGRYFLDVVKVDGDAYADLVSIAHTGEIYVNKGAADGKFTASSTPAATIDPIMDNGTGHEPIGLGDVNADGRADLLTLDGSGSLKLYKGKADAGLEAPTSPYGSTIDSSLTDGVGLELVGLLDYSRDGRADLVAVDEDGDVLSYAAQSSGSFAAPVTRSGSANPVRLGAGGHEFATEKPIWRRAGCETTGCDWP